MDPFNFADSLLAVLAQRLVRRNCPSCIASRPATSDEIDELLGDYVNAFGAEPPVGRDDVLAGWTKRHAGTGLGSKIIQTMAAALQTQVEYINRRPGTAARLVLTPANA